MFEQQKRARGTGLAGSGPLSEWELVLWAVLFLQDGNSSGPSSYRCSAHPGVMYMFKAFNSPNNLIDTNLIHSFSPFFFKGILFSLGRLESYVVHTRDFSLELPNFFLKSLPPVLRSYCAKTRDGLYIDQL